MNWVQDHAGGLFQLTLMHAYQSLLPLLIGLALAVPTGYAASRVPWVKRTLLPLGSLLYTIPSLALFIVLPLVLSTQILDVANVIVALSIYSWALLIHAAVAAFDTVDPTVVEASEAIGYTRTRAFWDVHLPLAMPQLIAGTRVVSVSNIAGVSVGALIGVPNLGYLFRDGLLKDFVPEVLTGLVLVLLLALVVDLLLVGLGRLLTPWERKAAPVDQNSAAEAETSAPAAAESRSLAEGASA